MGKCEPWLIWKRSEFGRSGLGLRLTATGVERFLLSVRLFMAVPLSS